MFSSQSWKGSYYNIWFLKTHALKIWRHALEFLARVSSRNVWEGGGALKGVGGLRVIPQEKKNQSFKFWCLKWPIWTEMTVKYGIYFICSCQQGGISPPVVLSRGGGVPHPPPLAETLLAYACRRACMEVYAPNVAYFTACQCHRLLVIYILKYTDRAYRGLSTDFRH